ncbi:MAG: hypothetical protein EOO43_12090 [Flavobacterium sp.]|nr:MAG: hypothetical protein EOO43_12090 [Flavobacterium sp.]
MINQEADYNTVMARIDSLIGYFLPGLYGFGQLFCQSSGGQDQNIGIYNKARVDGATFFFQRV